MIFKKKVNLWVFDLYEDPSFVYFGKYKQMMSGFFVSHFTDYYNIKFKIFGKDKLNPNQFNLTVLPCDTSNLLLNIFKKFPQEIYNICQTNNIKFIISYIRETIAPQEIKTLENVFEKHFLKQNPNSNNLKIFLNGYKDIQYSKYKNLFVVFSVFDHLLRTYLNKKLVSKFKVLNKKNIFKKIKKYKFSLFVGILEGRPHRQLFLLDCFKEKILQNDFFYNTVSFEKEKAIQQIYKWVLIKKSISFKDSIKFVEDIFKEKLYDVDGNVFDKNKLYDKHLEYQIPHQMLDSYVNIVLETNIDCPVITEKTFKPIVAGVPFIWYGYHGILKYLESEGYKRYPFIDYTFDLIQNHEERRLFLIKEIKRLSYLDLQKEVLKYKNIAKHNRNVFYKNTNKFEKFEEYLNGRV